MGDVIPIRLIERVELDEAERRALSDPSFIDAYTQLLPLDRLAQLRRQIEEHEAPAGQQVAAKVVAVLTGCLNISGPDVIADPSMFLAQMPEVLADQPATALWAAVWQLQRTRNYVPPPATVLAICEEVRRPHRDMLRAIEAMEKEHRRRRQAAERDVQREAERERDRARLREIEEQAVQLFGSGAPRPGDVELASSLSPAGMGHRGGKPVSWRNGLAAGEHWAATHCRRLALVQRVIRAHEQGRASDERAVAVTELIVVDEERAAREIEKLEHGATVCLKAEKALTGLGAVIRKINAASGLDTDDDDKNDPAKSIALLHHLADLADTREIIERQALVEWRSRLRSDPG
jgi:hypothetical protein